MARATLHIDDSGLLNIGFDTVMLKALDGKGYDTHPADGQLWVHINDCDLSFTLNRVTNEQIPPWQDPKTARREALKVMLKNFIYATGFLFALIGVYHLH